METQFYAVDVVGKSRRYGAL